MVGSRRGSLLGELEQKAAILRRRDDDRRTIVVFKHLDANRVEVFSRPRQAQDLQRHRPDPVPVTVQVFFDRPCSGGRDQFNCRVRKGKPLHSCVRA